jgi:four helix bundle protein
MKDFKKLMVWQQGMEIVNEVYNLISLLPPEEKYGMRSQIIRSAISLPVNVAESSAKTSAKDYKRYLEIALGSSFELETQLLVIKRRKWLNDELLMGLLDLVHREQKMLQSFIKKL